MKLADVGRLVIDLVTALVLGCGWSPSEVWSMDLWELMHWTQAAKARRHG